MKKTTKKSRDLSPGPVTAVKGGSAKLSANDNATLVRASKPTPKPKKDLPARVTVKGGGLGSVNENFTLVRGMKKATKKIQDLAPKPGAIKGGSTKLSANDNLTLVRGAKSA